jgi:FlaA1/EpsC-like NDP-sugar epimerase
LTLKSLRNRHLFVADALAVIIAPLVAFLVRFEEASWISQNLRLVGLYLLLSIPLRLAIFYAAGMYRRLWRQARSVS